jgi:hypothetical protein
MASLVPSVSGVIGFATAAMGAFATLGSSGISDGLKFLSALGEVVLPLMFGFLGSGVALMIGALVWIRREKTTPSAPSI